jgi:hypothetical protein
MNANQTPENIAHTSARRVFLPSLIWGASTFAVTFLTFWYLEVSGISIAMRDALTQRLGRPVEDALITVSLLSLPPVFFATIAGLCHRSWRIACGALLVYVIPIAVFFTAVVMVMK